MKDKIDLGCGLQKPGDDWIGLDKRKTVETDIIHDLESGKLPFEDNRFEKVRAAHILEHLSDEAYYSIVEEMARVCKPDGEVIVKVPHFLSWNAHDPDHQRCFSKISLNAFSIYHDFPTETPQPFGEVSHEYIFNESYVVDIFRRFLGDERTAKFLSNAVDEIRFRMEVEKKKQEAMSQ